MPFPAVETVIYPRNPVERVICQVRFPAILKIDSDVPADFQEGIRQYFPIYTEKPELAFEIPQAIRTQIASVLTDSAPKKNHEFVSEDGNWTVNLTRTFLSLSTSDYQQWNDFRHKFEPPLNALLAVYSPPFFSRIGLRYVDVIRRSLYGLASVDWDQLLQPHIAGFLSSPHIGDSIKSFENRAEIQLADENSLVRVATKFVDAEDGEGETNFLIDSDFFYAGRTPIVEAIDKLNFFNLRASRLFRWSITDKLHQAIKATNL